MISLDRKRIALVFLVAACAAAALLFGFRRPILRSVGHALVVDTTPPICDCIAVLAGDTPSRLMEGIELYLRDVGAQMVITQEPEPRVAPIFRRLGITLPSDPQFIKNTAVRLGVSPEEIFFIDEPVTSTYQEAEAVKRYMKKNGKKSVVLVTSPYHTRRALYIFRRVLGPEGIDVFVRPTKYDGFDPDKWWMDRRQARNTVFEFQKLVLYYLVYWHVRG